MRSGRFQCRWMVALLITLVALLPGTLAAADDYRYEAEFREVGVLAVGAYGQIEASLDLDEAECQKLVTDMVYGGLRAKFPSLRILNDQESALADLFWRVQEQRPVSAGGDEVVTEDKLHLQGLLRQTAWVVVSFDVFEANDGGYYGGVALIVERPVQLWPSLPQPKNSGTPKTFRITVYRRLYYIPSSTANWPFEVTPGLPRLV